MSPSGRSSRPGRPVMGRSLSELLESYLDEPDDRPGRRTRGPDLGEVLDTALRLAAAVAPGSVVGIAYAPAGGSTIVRLGGVRDIDRSLALSDRLADETARGLASVAAEHLILRSGDRVRLGADRGGELDAEQRSLLDGVALLAARAVARGGALPLGTAGGRVVHPGAAREPANGPGVTSGPGPSSGSDVEVA